MIADFEDTLSAILSNPEAMGQIMSLAKSLGGNQQSQAAPSPSQQDEERQEEGSSPPQLEDLFSLFSGNIDPSMLTMLSGIMKEYGSGQEDQNLALLAALRPFLKEKRQAKIDQAIKLAKFSRIARLAFQTMKGGEDFV